MVPPEASESTPPWPAAAKWLRVGDMQLDLRYRRLSHPEQPGGLELPQRVFDLLLLFLARPRELHTRSALLEHIWTGVIVEDANLSQAVWALRKALGESRKDWVRTVARSGYVFEPPAPVVAVTDPAPSLATVAGSGAGPATPVRRRRILAIAATAAAAAAIGMALLLPWRPERASADAPATTAGAEPVTVALLVVGNEHDRQARWPATVLHAWLEWKLDSLPGVNLLGEAHLAADGVAPPPHIVLISSGQAVGTADERYLRARIQGAAGSGQIELRGPTAQMPALIDELSRQVMAELLPTGTPDQWPRLDIQAPVAQRYATAYEAYEHRDYAASVRALQPVIRQAPGFGLARLQLALSLSRLGRARDATQHMAHARGDLQPLPESARQVLDAMALAIDPQRHTEAAAAYSELARQYPRRPSFRLAQAELLIRLAASEQARAALEPVDWQHQPLGVRIAWRLRQAEIDAIRSDAAGVRSHAAAAEQLARRGGEPWDYERARALLLQAHADAYEHREHVDLGRFRQAAALFAETGAELDALHAQVSAELTRPPSPDDSRIDALLARTRAGGYLGMEVLLLRRVAFQHYMAGDLDEYRRRLEEARAAAVAAGDPVGQRLLDVDLLHEDLLRGRLDSARERIARIRGTGIQGDLAIWLDQFEAFILGVHGRFDEALDALDHTSDQLAARGQAIADSAALRLSCARVELLVAQGELPRAAAELDLCSRSESPYPRVYSQLLRAELALVSADDASALAHLQTVRAQIEAMPQSPDRWMTQIYAAQLLGRGGALDEAARLYDATAEAMRGSGYEWLATDVRIGRAEIAAARGQWSLAARLAEAAREDVTPDLWQRNQRLDQVAVLVARADGRPDVAEAVLDHAHARAHELGDALAQVRLHSMATAAAGMHGCDPADRRALVARTGLRGADLGWLTASLPPVDDVEAVQAVATAHEIR